MTFDLDELKRLHAAATPGPWRVFREYHTENKHLIRRILVAVEADTDAFCVATASFAQGCEAFDNAESIVALHNAFLAMVDEIDRLRAEIRELKGFVQ